MKLSGMLVYMEILNYAKFQANKPPGKKVMALESFTQLTNFDGVS